MYDDDDNKWQNSLCNKNWSDCEILKFNANFLFFNGLTVGFVQNFDSFSNVNSLSYPKYITILNDLKKLPPMRTQFLLLTPQPISSVLFAQNAQY